MPPVLPSESGPHTAELATAVEAVRLAMRVCRRVQSGITPDVLEKNDRSPVTVADYASQAVVCRAIAVAFPDDRIVAEEDSAALRQPGQAPFLTQVREHLAASGLNAADDEVLAWIDAGGGACGSRFWTLDPIDGTKGFLRREQYAVSLALIVDGRIEIGLLGCPQMPPEIGARDAGGGSIFRAVRGRGAEVSAADEAAGWRPITASPTSDPAAARLCESVERQHSAHDLSARIAQDLGIAVPPVRMDSQAKYAAVARGEADLYLRLPTRADYRENIWDHAGGVLLVEEAGGRVTDLDGRPLDFTRGQKLTANRGLVVTNGRLHERVLDAVRRVGA
ncbi:MAG TPA: 3'(2'),5'-bisphosphate nucleotidase [Planctomycetaceae bacterium]|nr:3'(2'),5'-bisphosphate nucleotidase [Planctomycetaceae bacterium]